MKQVNVSGLVELSIPEEWHFLGPDDQTGSNPKPKGMMRLMALLGIGSRKHTRHQVHGPNDIHIAIHAWRLDHDFELPPVDSRPIRNDAYGYGPIGGTVIERGQVDIQGESHPWIIRQDPDDVAWDRETNSFITLPCSLDFEVLFSNSDRILCKVMCGLDKPASPLLETYFSVLHTLRPIVDSY